MNYNFHQSEQHNLDSYEEESKITLKLSQALGEIEQFHLIKQKLKERKNQRELSSKFNSQQSTNISHYTDVQLQINLDDLKAFVYQNEGKKINQKIVYVEKEEAQYIPIQDKFTTSEFLNYVHEQNQNGLKLKKKQKQPEQQQKIESKVIPIQSHTNTQVKINLNNPKSSVLQNKGKKTNKKIVYVEKEDAKLITIQNKTIASEFQNHSNQQEKSNLKLKKMLKLPKQYQKIEAQVIPIQNQFTTSEFLSFINEQKINDLKLKKKIISPEQQLKKKAHLQICKK